MIHRMDPPEDPDREPLPKHIEPMLATLSKNLPRDEDNYAFEVKWDGVRSIAYVEGGRARFESRRGGDITSRYPELRGLGPALSSTAAVLDGEIVAFEGERPSFERLQRRMHVSNERAVRRLMGEVPVVYVIFDLLWLEGHSTLELPYRERRKLLDELAPQGPSWQTPAAHEGGGAELLDATRRLELEGVVAKRLESVYEPGRRSRAWLKVKNHNSQEFVVGGWAPGKGARSTSLGALLIGYYESTGARRAAEVRRTRRDRPHRGRAAAAGRAPRTVAPGHEPVLAGAACEGRGVRRARARRRGGVHGVDECRRGPAAPVYLGLRDDPDPRDVVREDVARAG